MTDQEAKAEAQKIVETFYEQIPEKVFETSLNYDILHELSKKNAIHHVKGILNLQNEKIGKWLPSVVPDSIDHWKSILKAIEEL